MVQVSQNPQTKETEIEYQEALEVIDKNLDVIEYKDQMKLRKAYIGIPVLTGVPSATDLFEGQLVYVSNASLDRLYTLRSSVLKYVNFS